MGQKTWRWNTDIFSEMAHLQRFGDEGWEVAGVDRWARFVCHRDDETPRRWEYRRVAVDQHERMIADGWERCAAWFRYFYYKRPKPQPITELPPFPDGRVYVSLKAWLLLALVGVIVACAMAAALASQWVVLLPLAGAWVALYVALTRTNQD